MSTGIPHLRRRRRRLALLMLPVLVVRALIPVGFMPTIERGGVHLGFCPGEAQPPGALAGALAAAHLAHHHHPGGDHGAPAGGASHPPCLFAVSASPAFAPATRAPAMVPAAPTLLIETPPTRLFLPPIVRAQSPRAPPLPA